MPTKQKETCTAGAMENLVGQHIMCRCSYWAGVSKNAYMTCVEQVIFWNQRIFFALAGASS